MVDIGTHKKKRVSQRKNKSDRDSEIEREGQR